MSASNYLEDEILDHILGAATFTAPATVYIALYTANPGESASITTNEVTGTGYARVAVTNNLTNWPASSGGYKSNGTVITFATAGSGGWGTITHFAIVDSASGAGNSLFYGALTDSKTVAEGDECRFNIGAITITMD